MGRIAALAAVRAKRLAAGDSGAGSTDNAATAGIPSGFEAVGEALAPGSGVEDQVVEACQVVGRAWALDGASLEETADALRATWSSVRGSDPTYDAMTALLVAWSDTTLSYLHQLSCEDPMTGLASLAHLRSRTSELYRAAPLGVLGASHVLVVCHLADEHGAPAPTPQAEQFTRALHLSQVGDAARTVFAGTETIGRVGRRRVVVLARRDGRIGARVGLLRTLVSDLELGRHAVRVWIEGLPESEASAATLLDELARS